MKILMLGSKEYPFGVAARFDPKAGGGIEVHVEKLSKYLARRGHEVTIITRRFPGQLAVETHGSLRIIRVPFISNRLLRGITFNKLAAFRALRLLRKEKFDLIHCHAIFAGFFGAFLTRLTRTPFVFTPHGTVFHYSFAARLFLRPMERVALRCASRMLFISKPARDMLTPLTSKPFTLLTNAIDLEDYTTSQRTPKRGSLTFLFLGRLEPVKGIDTLIEAFTTLLRKHPHSRLLIAGTGTQKSRIIDLILKANTKQIKYLGWTDPRKALRDSDVFVLPSTERGQPVALLEAMASGKIILTSLSHIKPGRTGITCPPRDPKALARRMSEISSSPSRYLELCKAARVQARTMSWETTVKLFEKEYEKVLSNRT